MLKTKLRTGIQSFSRKRVHNIVATGKENLMPTRIGWTLWRVTMPIKYVLRRMSIMQESGIGKQRKEWDVWCKSLTDLFDYGSLNVDSPSVLSTNDNIIVEFLSMQFFYVHV